MTAIEIQPIREKLESEKARLGARLREIQQALDELGPEKAVSLDRVMALDKAEKIAAGILSRQPNLFRKLAQ